MAKTETKTGMDKAMDERPAIEDMPLESLRDYRLYNEEAARLNKKLGVKPARYPYKQCPEELHPKQRIVFGRNDGNNNPQPVYLSNQLIEFKRTLVPGQTYDLPVCVVNYLSEKGYPVWKWRTLANGEQETYMSHKTPRFSLRTVYAE